MLEVPMAVFRIDKTRDYTVMSNHHLRNKALSLKSKGLLSMMLSLPEDWNYTTRGLSKICKEGTDSIGSALKELEQAGYIVRNRLRDSKGKITDVEYFIYETPHNQGPDAPDKSLPDTVDPDIWSSPNMEKAVITATMTPAAGTVPQYPTFWTNRNIWGIRFWARPSARTSKPRNAGKQDQMS